MIVKKPSSTQTSRRTHSVNSFNNASECIGKIENGMSLFAITRGQFSMIDAILHTISDISEPCDVSVWTWAIADYEVESLVRLMIDKRIKSARMLIDFSAKKRNAEIIQKWVEIFGPYSVGYVVNHAKIATVTTQSKKVLLRGSMNLNFNPRYEQLDITEGGADYTLIKEIEAEIIAETSAETPTWRSAAKLSGLENSFGSENLSIFEAKTTWAK